MDQKTRLAFDYDNEKAALVKRTTNLESDLEKDFEKVKEYMQEYGKNALIIGGSLLATYLVVRMIAGSSSEEKEPKYPKGFSPYMPQQPMVQVVKEREESPIVKQIKSSIALFLMSIAKQKLMDFLAKNKAQSE